MASTLVAKLIFFIATLFVSAIVAVTFIEAIQRNESGLKIQQEILQNRMRTDFTIESFSYDEVESEITLYARNTGTTKINIDRLSVYINGDRIQKNDDFQLNIEEFESLNDPRLWEEYAIIRINIKREISVNQIYEIIITDANGNYAKKRDRPIISNSI